MSRSVSESKFNWQWIKFRKRWLVCHVCKSNKISLNLVEKKWFSGNFRTLKSWKLIKLTRLLRQLVCLFWTSFSWTCYLTRLKSLLTLIFDSDLRMCLLKISLNSFFIIIKIYYKFSCVFWFRILFLLD